MIIHIRALLPAFLSCAAFVACACTKPASHAPQPGHLEFCGGTRDACAVQAKKLLGEGKTKDALPILAAMCQAGDGRACTVQAVRIPPAVSDEEYWKDARAKSALFLKACDLGDPLGCFFYGSEFEKRYLEANPDPRAHYFDKGCQGGHAPSCFTLGQLHQRGRAAQVDVPLARTLYRKSCDLGFGQACTSLGKLLEGSSDRSSVAPLYATACKLGSRVGCANLGVLAAREQPPHRERAAEYFARACELQDKPSCTELPALLTSAPNKLETREEQALVQEILDAQSEP